MATEAVVVEVEVLVLVVAVELILVVRLGAAGASEVVETTEVAAVEEVGGSAFRGTESTLSRRRGAWNQLRK